MKMIDWTSEGDHIMLVLLIKCCVKNSQCIEVHHFTEKTSYLLLVAF